MIILKNSLIKNYRVNVNGKFNERFDDKMEKILKNSKENSLKVEQ
jgi:hypothetical protein